MCTVYCVMCGLQVMDVRESQPELYDLARLRYAEAYEADYTRQEAEFGTRERILKCMQVSMAKGETVSADAILQVCIDFNMEHACMLDRLVGKPAMTGDFPGTSTQAWRLEAPTPAVAAIATTPAAGHAAVA